MIDNDNIYQSNKSDRHTSHIQIFFGQYENKNNFFVCFIAFFRFLYMKHSTFIGYLIVLDNFDYDAAKIFINLFFV